MSSPVLVKAMLLAIALSLAPAAAARAEDAQPMPGAEKVHGYLGVAELPDSLALLPPPPALGSAAEAMDMEVARLSLTLEGGPRYKLATLDADLSFPTAAGTFACAVGVAIGPDATPTLYGLLQKAMADAGAATKKAKDHYRHARPFMIDEHPTCEASWDERLRANGSYPSGHTSIGWAWGEILAEIAPDKTDAILSRARAFGESRIVCNAHWASDVMEGRLIGSATVARLHASAAFRDDLAKAKTEIDAAGAAPQRDCADEAKALGATPWLTP
jgi:acid phosphatase (class A)